LTQSTTIGDIVIIEIDVDTVIDIQE